MAGGEELYHGVECRSDFVEQCGVGCEWIGAEALKVSGVEGVAGITNVGEGGSVVADVVEPGVQVVHDRVHELVAVSP